MAHTGFPYDDQQVNPSHKLDSLQFAPTCLRISQREVIKNEKFPVGLELNCSNVREGGWDEKSWHHFGTNCVLKMRRKLRDDEGNEKCNQCDQIGQLFKAFGYNSFAQISHMLRQVLLSRQNVSFL